MKLKNLLKNEEAILSPIMTCLFSLSIIIIMYAMFIPMLTFITNVLISLGAPPEATMFYLKCARWGMYLFAVGAILTMFANVYKKTYDSRIEQQFGGFQ